MAISIESDQERFRKKQKALEIDKLFRSLVKLEGSDLHLKVDRPPYMRVAGTLRPMNRDPVDDDEMVRLVFPMMDERNRRIFDEEGGADFAYSLDIDGKDWRFRVNALQQMGHVGLVARRVNNWIPNLEQPWLGKGGFCVFCIALMKHWPRFSRPISALTIRPKSMPITVNRSTMQTARKKDWS